MIYMVNIIVRRRKDLKLLTTGQICEISPLHGEAVFDYWRKDKDIGAKKNLELASCQLLDKNGRWHTMFDGIVKGFYNNRQSKEWVKDLCKKLDTYAVDNQQLYIEFRTTNRWIDLYITPKKENKDDVNNNP